MIFQQECVGNWMLLKKQHKSQAVANNKKDNKTRREHTYEVNDLVLSVQNPYERTKQPKKISASTEEPCKILKFYTNGNVCIRRGRYDKEISIRRLRPYFKRD